MDENLRAFLEKFAELERRVRRLAAEDRSLRQEVRSLKEKLSSVEAEAVVLRDVAGRERGAREKARDHLDALIARLEGAKGADESNRLQTGGAVKDRRMQSGGGDDGAGLELAEAAESEL
jgi:predicted nuclease with TOPRIM domain